MIPKDRKYYSERLLTLRNVIDGLIEELEKEIEPSSAPRKRRNLKEERVIEHEINYALGKWGKPRKFKSARQ